MLVASPIPDNHGRMRAVRKDVNFFHVHRWINAAIILDRTNLTHDGMARNAIAGIYDPRISRSVTVLHEQGMRQALLPLVPRTDILGNRR